MSTDLREHFGDLEDDELEDFMLNARGSDAGEEERDAESDDGLFFDDPVEPTDVPDTTADLE